MPPPFHIARNNVNALACLTNVVGKFRPML